MKMPGASLATLAILTISSYGCSVNEYWAYSMCRYLLSPEGKKDRVSPDGREYQDYAVGAGGLLILTAAVETILLPVTLAHDLILYLLRQGEERPKDSGEEPFPSPLSHEALKERGPPGLKRAVIQSRTWRAARVDNAIFSSRVLDQRDRIAPQRP